jgi:hypothetical protein
MLASLTGTRRRSLPVLYYPIRNRLRPAQETPVTLAHLKATIAIILTGAAFQSSPRTENSRLPIADRDLTFLAEKRR